MNYLHARGIILQDLKPDTILILNRDDTHPIIGFWNTYYFKKYEGPSI